MAQFVVARADRGWTFSDPFETYPWAGYLAMGPMYATPSLGSGVVRDGAAAEPLRTERDMSLRTERQEALRSGQEGRLR